MGAFRNFDHVFNFVFSSLKTLFVTKFPKKLTSINYGYI